MKRTITAVRAWVLARSRLLKIGFAVVCLIGLSVQVVVLGRSLSPDDPETTSAAPAADVPTSPPTSPVAASVQQPSQQPSRTPSAKRTVQPSTQPSTGAEVDLPELPPEVPEEGSYVASQVMASGQILVTQWIRSREGLASVTLAAPAGVGVTPRGSALAVLADGQEVSTRGTVSAQPVTLTFPEPARLVYLSYQLDGAVTRSDSASSRALAVVTSLDVAPMPAAGVVRQSVTGSGSVLSLACLRPGISTAAPRPCGGADAGRWVVDLSGSDREDRVMAQLNLA